MYLKKDGTVQFEALENANNFKRFYSKLAGGLNVKLLKAPNKFTIQTTKNKTTPRLHKTYQLTLNSKMYLKEVVKKNLLSLYTSKATGMHQIQAKFLKDGAKVLVFPLRNIMNLSIKL